jgi:hypothetical protein
MAPMDGKFGRSIRAGMAGAMLALAWPASAQPAASAQPRAPAPPASAAPDEAIIVTGRRDRAETVRDFIDRVTIPSDGQLAAFHDAPCPASFGLPAGHNAVVAALIREAAARTRLPVARPGCAPNILVIVAENGGDFVARLRRARPAWFAVLGGAELRALAAADGPVRSWQIVATRGADGRPTTRISFLQIGGGVPRYIGEAELLTGVRPSLTARPTRQDLVLALVVFDLAAVEGLSLSQLAGHAAMRTLARTDAAAAGPAPGRSILTLFDDRGAGQAPAAGLTRWDSAYLAALYAAGDTLAAAQQRSAMARIFGRALAAEPPAR